MRRSIVGAMLVAVVAVSSCSSDDASGPTTTAATVTAPEEEPTPAAAVTTLPDTTAAAATEVVDDTVAPDTLVPDTLVPDTLVPDTLVEDTIDDSNDQFAGEDALSFVSDMLGFEMTDEEFACIEPKVGETTVDDDADFVAFFQELYTAMGECVERDRLKDFLKNQIIDDEKLSDDDANCIADGVLDNGGFERIAQSTEEEVVPDWIVDIYEGCGVPTEDLLAS